jgi:hypothetical protein
MANELVKVPFHGDVIEAVQDERGVWCPLKRMCENLGLQPHNQAEKLKAKPWATTLLISVVAEDGKQREVTALHLDCVPMWLATIEPSRVKATLRAKLALYQREAARVLAEHFLGPRNEAASAPLAPELMRLCEQVQALTEKVNVLGQRPERPVKKRVLVDVRSSSSSSGQASRSG